MLRRARRVVHGLPPDFRPRLEAARLDTLALLRALDQAQVPPQTLQPQLDTLSHFDADCVEALWALDQPPGTLDLGRMLRDTLDSLQALPQARAHVRARLSTVSMKTINTLESNIRPRMDPCEAYNDVPGHDPQNR